MLGTSLDLVLRFFHYGLLLGLFGTAACQALVMRSSAHRAEPTQPSTVLVAMAGLAPLITSLHMLAASASMMGVPLWSLEWAMLFALVRETSLGWAFGVRVLVLLAACLVLATRPDRKQNLAMAAVLFALALATLPWMGHAAASQGLMGTVHRAADAVHLWAAGLWMGAIGWFLARAVRTRLAPGTVAQHDLLVMMHRFAPLGIGLVALVILTGVVNIMLVIGPPATWRTMQNDYAILLGIKVALVGLMLACAGFHAQRARHFGVLGDPSAPRAGAVLNAIRISLAVEFSLAFAILGLVAALGLKMPAG